MLQHPIRYLDIDDLQVLSLLLKPNVRLKEIAGKLNLTPPAIIHRFNKYRTHLPDFELTTSGTPVQRLVLSEKSKEICRKARKTLNFLTTEITF